MHLLFNWSKALFYETLLLFILLFDVTNWLYLLTRYTILREIGQGFFGEMWLVFQAGNIMDEFVLKQIKVEFSMLFYDGIVWRKNKVGPATNFFVCYFQTQVPGHTSFYYSGLREKHFGGMILTNGEHIGRFVESFDNKNDIYIVSFFEGISLEELIYNVKGTSNWWLWLRKTEAGRKIMKQVIFQLVSAKLLRKTTNPMLK